MVEHFIEMMGGSLRLKEPWYVEGAKFDAKNQRVDIYVAVRPDAAFACPECGGETSRCDEKTMASTVSYWVNLANDKRSLKDLARPTRGCADVGWNR